MLLPISSCTCELHEYMFVLWVNKNKRFLCVSLLWLMKHFYCKFSQKLDICGPWPWVDRCLFRKEGGAHIPNLMVLSRGRTFSSETFTGCDQKRKLVCLFMIRISSSSVWHASPVLHLSFSSPLLESLPRRIHSLIIKLVYCDHCFHWLVAKKEVRTWALVLW